MKRLAHFVLPLMLLFLSSCQTEEYEVETEQEQNSITINTEVYDLIYRASMHDGFTDDEIDNSSCISIEFPYTLTYQGVKKNIMSETVLRDFLADLPANHPEIVPDFPFTAINAGHQRVTVRNRQQFAGLQQACRNMIKERGRPITCLQFSFPLQLISYERSSQQTGSAVLTSKEELFYYFSNLSPNSVVNFVYPLEVSRSNTVISIASRTKLEILLRECEE